MTEDEMVGWHHRLNGHKFEQTLGDSERQGSLACCSQTRLEQQQQQMQCKNYLSLFFIDLTFLGSQAPWEGVS